MFNCGILAMELPAAAIHALFAMKGNLDIDVDINAGNIRAKSDNASQDDFDCSFTLNEYDKNLVGAGGCQAFVDANY